MPLENWDGKYDLEQAIAEVNEAGAYLYDLRETNPLTPMRLKYKIRFIGRVRVRNVKNAKPYVGTDSHYAGNAVREALEKFIIDRPDVTKRGRKRGKYDYFGS